jgi:hypothetical protein
VVHVAPIVEIHRDDRGGGEEHNDGQDDLHLRATSTGMSTNTPSKA